MTRPVGVYGRGEVAWLIQMDHEGAVDYDAYPPTMHYGRTDEDGNATPSSGSSLTGAGTAQEDPQLFVIARWVDVRRARRGLILEQLREEQGLATHVEIMRMAEIADRVMQLRGSGWTEDEVADELGVSRSTVRRRFRAGVDALLQALGEHHAPDRLSYVSACLECAARPRATLEAVRYRVKGGWRTSQPERTAGLCVDCIVEWNTPAVTRRQRQLLKRAGVGHLVADVVEEAAA